MQGVPYESVVAVELAVAHFAAAQQPVVAREAEQPLVEREAAGI